MLNANHLFLYRDVFFVQTFNVIKWIKIGKTVGIEVKSQPVRDHKKRAEEFMLICTGDFMSPYYFSSID